MDQVTDVGRVRDSKETILERKKMNHFFVSCPPAMPFTYDSLYLRRAPPYQWTLPRQNSLSLFSKSPQLKGQFWMGMATHPNLQSLFRVMGNNANIISIQNYTKKCSNIYIYFWPVRQIFFFLFSIV